MHRWFFANDEVVCKDPTPRSSLSVIEKTPSPSLPDDIYWKFNVKCDWTLCLNETLAICGSIPILGNWNPKHCLPLNKEDNSSYWSLTVLLPCKDDIRYRYLIVATNSRGQRIVRFWETHGVARLLSCNQTQNANNVLCDTFGILNDKYKIERGWITPGIIVVQFKLFQPLSGLKTSRAKSQLHIKISPVQVKPQEKCGQVINTKLMTKSSSTLLKESETIKDQSTTFTFSEVATLQDQTGEFHKQPKYGTFCAPHAMLIFNLTLSDFEQTAYVIDLFEVFPKLGSDAPAHHSGYQYVLPQELKNSEGTLNLTIMCATKHRPTGSLKCDYLIVRPLHSYDFDTDIPLQRYWNTKDDCVYIGHRGCGCSYWSGKIILRENTIESFALASEHGADMVEFDVQLTKDRVPVLYHDFQLYISRKFDVDHQVNDMMHLPLSADEINFLKQFERHIEGELISLPLSKFTSDQLARVKVFEPLKDCIQENPCVECVKNNRPFTELKNVFKDLNPKLGFIIELKWPQKCIDDSTQKFFIQDFDKNEFVDVILHEVLDIANSRRIVFSSYDADICTMIRLKQNRFPVLFIIHDNFIGKKYLDPRGNCISSGIYFANAMEFLGIIANYNNIIQTPGKISETHKRNLCLFICGPQCSNEDLRKYLKELGVDGIIFDRINNDLKPEDLKRNIFLIELMEELLENNIKSKKSSI